MRALLPLHRGRNRCADHEPRVRLLGLVPLPPRGERLRRLGRRVVCEVRNALPPADAAGPVRDLRAAPRDLPRLRLEGLRAPPDRRSAGQVAVRERRRVPPLVRKAAAEELPAVSDLEPQARPSQNRPRAASSQARRARSAGSCPLVPRGGPAWRRPSFSTVCSRMEPFGRATRPPPWRLSWVAPQASERLRFPGCCTTSEPIPPQRCPRTGCRNRGCTARCCDSPVPCRGWTRSTPMRASIQPPG